jgi:hypothetical protein
VVATIRSDHLHYCERHPDLLPVMRGRGYYPLGPPDARALGKMIQKPARCAGLEMPDRLAKSLLKEASLEAGRLPLMAFTLGRLFDLRDGTTLSEKVYDNLGGVTGALDYHIRMVEQKLRQNEAIGDALPDRLSDLFQRLAGVSGEGFPTRRRVLFADLGRDVKPLVDDLIKAGLLTAEGEGAGRRVSLSHETLFEAWPQLAGWIAGRQEEQRLLRRAEIESQLWEAHPHDPAYLWRGKTLRTLLAVLERLDDAVISERVRRFAEPHKGLAARLEDASLSHRERMEIGHLLEALGDPRPGVGLRADGLPDIVWCQVPKGEITLERGAGTFPVPPFYIAKCPVTWIQYRAFLVAPDGYQKTDWWAGLAAEWPTEAGDQHRRHDNYPADNVSWYDAAAYCRWLTKPLGYEIRLPTEWEWQMATALEDPGNEYPWGPEWDPTRANTSESGLGGSTAVGLYPQAASPVGALDMSGNVQEWCLNEYNKTERVELGGDASRVVHGGSWDDSQFIARAAFRDHFNPHDRFNYLGFRLCCTDPSR